MQLSHQTILITGGTSGIGLELAKQLLALHNTIIVTGRDLTKLQEVKKNFPDLHTIQSDVSDPQAIKKLHEQVIKDFPDLQVLINNAGFMRKINLHDANEDLLLLTKEIETNLMGPIRMVQQFLPHLKKQPSAAIVNVSSGLAFVPLPISPVYCSTKAALHSFTQSLRVQLKNTAIQVFELAPPGTETPLFSDGFDEEEIKSFSPMPVATLVKHAISGLKKDNQEICPGLSGSLKWMNRLAPNFILKQLAKSADKMIS